MSGEKKPISFVAYGPFVLMWPAILTGFVLVAIRQWFPERIGENQLALIWMSVLTVNVVALGFDFDRIAVVVGTLVGLLVLVVLWSLGIQYHKNFIGEFFRYLGAKDFGMTKDTVLLSNTVLAGCLVLRVCLDNMNRRWEVRTGNLVHMPWGGNEKQFPISNTSPITLLTLDWMDRCVMVDGGSIQYYDQAGQTHTLGLIFRANAIVKRIAKGGYQSTVTTSA